MSAPRRRASQFWDDVERALRGRSRRALHQQQQQHHHHRHHHRPMDLLVVGGGGGGGGGAGGGGGPWPDWESYCGFYLEDLRNGRLPCACGEAPDRRFAWSWEENGAGMHVLSGGDREVLFHPVYSPGTAAVRGTRVLERNAHHYWEVKVLTKLYGTDVMIGVGTPELSMDERQYKFCSMLGYEDQSWGYSYRGTLQHGRLTREYGPPFGIGSIVGVHLDMYRGTLEYYMNRKPLGVAFRGLKTKDLYPMVCSTAAQSSVRLISAYTFPDTLEMRCLRIIKSDPELRRQFGSIPGLARLIKPEYFWSMPNEKSDTSKSKENRKELSVEDEAILPLETVLEIETRQRKRLRTNKWGLECSADPDHISHRDFLRRVGSSVRTNNRKKSYYSPSCQRCSLRSDRSEEKEISELRKKALMEMEEMEGIYGDLDEILVKPLK